MDKKELIDYIKYYAHFLLEEFEETLEEWMIAKFSDHRYRIDSELKEHKVENKYIELLHKADKVLIERAKDVLYWWKLDGIIELRQNNLDIIKKEMWYWWIDEIYEGKYPFELLPDYLKDVAKKYYEGKKWIEKDY